jgi:hypothetical protein
VTAAAPHVDSHKDILERFWRIGDTVRAARLVTPKRVVDIEEILSIEVWVVERPLHVVVSGKDTERAR